MIAADQARRSSMPGVSVADLAADVVTDYESDVMAGILGRLSGPDAADEIRGR